MPKGSSVAGEQRRFDQGECDIEYVSNRHSSEHVAIGLVGRGGDSR